MGTVKYSGPIASFHCPTEATIRSLKVYFSPKQAGEGDPSPENVREISGWNELTVVQTKENLIQRIYSPSSKAKISNLTLAPDYKFTMTSNVESYVANNPGSYENGYIDIDIDQINLSNQIHIRAKVKQLTNPLNVDYIRISPQGVNANGSDIPIINGIIDSTFKYVPGKNHFLELKNCGATLEISELMLTVPNVENIISLDWSASIGTIYGGYVDLITGEVVQTHYCLISGITNIIRKATITAISQIDDYTRFWIGIAEADGLPARKAGTIPIFCNMLPINIDIGYTNYTVAANRIGVVDQYLQSVWCIMPTSAVGTTKETIINYLNSNHLAYTFEMENPITYQLTSQQLQTFLGQNNVWSNADYVEVEYDLHETQNILERKQFIIANQPHIETVISGNTTDSDSIAHFKTDMAAPIRSLKVNFAPVQEGSGTPSPDNVRPISGWNSIDITRCGKNLLKYTATPCSRSGLTPVTTRNDDHEVVSILWSGSTTDSNWFNNANYVEKQYNVFIGRFTISTENNQMPLVIARNSKVERSEIETTDIPEYTKTFTKDQIQASDSATWYRLECWPRNTSEKIVNSYVYPMVRFPDDPAGFEPYKGQQISIALSGTFYGGYIDLITGELVETQGMEIFNGSEAWSSSGSLNGDRWRFNTPASYKYNMTYGNNATGAVIADWAYAGANGENALANVSLPIITAGNYNPQFYMGIPLEWNITTVEDFKAYLAEHPLHVVTNLAMPNRYQLSPQILKTLRGINNIWSDAGSVEVQYWTH